MSKVKAEARRDRIRRRLVELDEEARLLRDELAVVEGYLALGEQLDRDEPLRASLPLARGENPQRPNNPHWTKTVEASLELIADAGRPLNAGELLDGLKGRGMIITGKDPRNVLATALWRDQGKQIVRLDKRGYWPKGKAVPKG